MFSMAIDYFLLIVIGFFGILQIVASRNGLYGLRLFADKRKGYVLGTIMFAGAFVWFFGSGNRNIEGHITGVQGVQQFELVLAGTVSSILVTAVIVSIKHLKTEPRNKCQKFGLEQIREITYLQAFARYLKSKE